MLTKIWGWGWGWGGGGVGAAGALPCDATCPVSNLGNGTARGLHLNVCGSTEAESCLLCCLLAKFGDCM
jgi:hypothetical protein